MRWLTLTILPDGHRIESQGLDEFEIAACHAVMRLRPRHDEQTRAWIAEATGVVPTIRRVRVPAPPPSGVDLTAGEDGE